MRVREVRGVREWGLMVERIIFKVLDDGMDIRLRRWVKIDKN